MTSKSFSRFTKSIFLDSSWIDIVVKALNRLPMPYWATCSLIGLIMFIGISVPSIRNQLMLLGSQGDDIPTLTYWFVVSLSLSISFLIPYSLYILGRLENILKHNLYDL